MIQKLNSRYTEQVKTLIEILPFIAKNHNFALKGGTAINLFVLNMPRLSVDIDLCYLPLSQRDVALKDIDAFTTELSRQLTSIGFKCRTKNAVQGYESTIFVQSQRTEVKVEINLVVRGAVSSPIIKPLCPLSVDMFQRKVEMLCLNMNDLFAGKICAALDRQHPRDFFDIYMFLKEFSYTRELHQTFIAYLLSSKRPISELIRPNYLDIKRTYQKQFSGMTSMNINVEDLEQTRNQIVEKTASFFSSEEKEFLLSFKQGEPKWDLFPLAVIQNLPSIQWKLHNIKMMDPKKRSDAVKKLELKLSA
ncbi:MAG: nucleotidyl transferase AbiEii/AbiGii toxin family protein [Alphaproteobacteria bacterium]|nr:nucleotidyl transferase AbiEii/AbiGii toxin family protein [Alphaproteobacteria bacterium]